MRLVRQLECSGEDVPTASTMARWSTAALRAADYAPGAAELTVRIVADEESRELNRRWRGKDRPTNVLAFPAAAQPRPPDESALPLGDLVIAAAVVRREAAEQQKTELQHWCHLVVHGTLHLAGLEHESATDAARMEELEKRVLAEFGFPNPYEIR